MRSSLVSYRTPPCKALALPHENEIVVFDDIEKYQTGGPGKLATRVELSRDNLFLYLNVFCNDPEPQKVINTNTADDRSLWTGDLLEIFFGAIAPQPWQLQLCVGAGGGRFDSQGRYDEWTAKTMLADRVAGRDQNPAFFPADPGTVRRVQYLPGISRSWGFHQLVDRSARFP